MAKYLVIHPVGSEITLESVAPVAKATKVCLTSDAYWIRSVYCRDVGKMFCEWDAKNPQAIMDILNKVLPQLPTEGVYEQSMVVNSEDFR